MIVKGFCSFIFLMITMALCDASSSRFGILDQNLSVKKDSRLLNRTPVKSIQSKDGDIIDCVRISHQPAFDHPLLKDHKIQTRPSFHPEGLFSESKSSNNKDIKNSIPQLWHLNGRCPDKTIPIKRTKQEDILRASLIQSFGKKESITNPSSIHTELTTTATEDHQESAAAFVRGDEYYGAKAIINVWEPQVQVPGEFSSSEIWIAAGSFDSNLNSILAGWHVLPRLYGDNNTRLFIYWTRDNFQSTGCYNLLCSGFVQTSNEVALGATISPLSTFFGTQFVITILIWKDQKQDVWWLQYGNDTLVGYWPASLFTHLATNASLIEWGGQVFNLESENGLHTTTQMGSGHFPEEGLGGASFLRNLQVVDDSLKLRAPKNIDAFATKPNCYNITLGKSDNWGDFVFYGGPGRNPNCV
ncbi:hypothetical protein ACH5RR_000595 [Cinchona calisaya]|uniref:Neprosin PEP catalytic domain-containing protein n=1 Tax=Cinchona calisaya TaxID=153742 RepID=A0ABD3B253_9GENT